MDVRCERCNTEYEFDDALVSGRGTTVKCTNCGHKFKIRRSDGDFSEDFWNVATADGRTLVFTSLRELQRAIQNHLVERSDKLSRGGRPPKPIGSIPELAPFFDQRDNYKANLPPMREPMNTATGLAPPPPTSDQMPAAGKQPVSSQSMKSRPPPPPGASPPHAAPPQARARTASKPPEGPVPYMTQSIPLASVKSTLIGAPLLDERGQSVANAAPPTPPPVPPPPAMRSRMASVPPPATEREPEPDTQRFDQAADALANARRQSSKPPPLPARARSSRPPAPAVPQVTVQTPAMPIASNNPTVLGVGNAASAAAQTPPMTTTMPVAQTSPLPSPRATPVAPAIPDTTSPLPPPTPQMRRQLISEMDDDEAPRMRRSYASLSDAPPSMGRRRSVGGFIVAVVVIGCIGMLGAVWVNKNGFPSFGPQPKPTTAAAPVDPRVATFLTTGEKALADGNLDLAKESFDKASALSERDPHVLLGVARLAAARADVAWLKSRLLPSDATDEHRLTRDMLAEGAAAARKAADDALAVAPDDPGALRAKIDALRISGDRDAPRPLTDRIKASSTQPETAYVLAALDLAEVEPLWSTVIDRLKIAAAVESGPGRARAALVYALARSGNVAAAKEELDRLKALPRQHPLTPQLASFVDRAKASPQKPAADGGAAIGSAMAVNDPPDPKNPRAGGGGDPAMPRDPRALVAAGEKARIKGDYEAAKKMYNAAVEINSNDSEALAGLGAVAYAQRDLAGARSFYKRVLSVNPNYTPALVGLGDVEWDSGDRAAATKIYKDIVDRLPDGAYPPRVKQRIEGGGGGASGAGGGGGGGGGSSPPPENKGDKSDQGGF
jgi:predicted Zn finger-like uncharacterized protein